MTPIKGRKFSNSRMLRNATRDIRACGHLRGSADSLISPSGHERHRVDRRDEKRAPQTDERSQDAASHRADRRSLHKGSLHHADGVRHAIAQRRAGVHGQKSALRIPGQALNAPRRATSCHGLVACAITDHDEHEAHERSLDDGLFPMLIADAAPQGSAERRDERGVMPSTAPVRAPRRRRACAELTDV